MGVHCGGGVHCALIKMAWVEFAARKVISTGSAGLTTVKVTVTGLNVPGVNAGIVTTAFVTLTTVSDCNPVPAFMWSIVTDPGPDATPNDAKPKGNAGSSVTVVLGVHGGGAGGVHRTLIKMD